MLSKLFANAQEWFTELQHDPHIAPRVWVDVDTEQPVMLYARLSSGQPKINLISAKVSRYDDSVNVTFTIPRN